MQETQETWVQSLGWEDPLEKEMATHSSILAWKIPWTRGAWWAAVHGVAKSRTRLRDFTFTECLFLLIKSILDITYVFATLIFLPSLIHTSLPKALLPGITVPLPVLLHLIVQFS